MDYRSRIGYDYSYRFRVEAEIIPLYKTCGFIIRRIEGLKIYLFEIRTNFKLKSSIDDGGQIMMLGSERFGAGAQEDEDEECSLLVETRFRLNVDYWMSDHETQSLFSDALDFAKQRPASDASLCPTPLNFTDFANKPFSVIPVVVELDVWTVQQEDEPINAAIDRAIRPESLIPLYLWWTCIPKGSMQFDEMPYLDRKNFLMFLPRIRVEDAAGLALMEVCPVCSRSPVVGAQISFLPCNHACHSHCVFHWLQRSNYSCPSCGVRIPRDFESEPEIDLESEPEIDLEPLNMDTM